MNLNKLNRLFFILIMALFILVGCRASRIIQEAEKSFREQTEESAADTIMATAVPETVKDMYSTDQVPEGKPVPVEPENNEISDVEKTCSLSVSCAVILDNTKKFNKEKLELVPEDGIIFMENEVIFYDGESVFNLLQREMKKNKIHMEFTNTPVYNSAYIEGINNIYEFDCGELSGWMYKVNDWFPNYGCSRYQLKEGDVVEWIYTCDLGRDIGGYSAADGGNTP